MNIDKDIEILTHLGHEDDFTWYCENLEITDGDIIDDAIWRVLKELETYKKIAEKLAYYTKDTKKLITDCVGWGCTKGIECTDCIIDWARKEVEKDE